MIIVLYSLNLFAVYQIGDRVENLKFYGWESSADSIHVNVDSLATNDSKYALLLFCDRDQSNSINLATDFQDSLWAIFNKTPRKIKLYSSVHGITDQTVLNGEGWRTQNSTNLQYILSTENHLGSKIGDFSENSAPYPYVALIDSNSTLVYSQTMMQLDKFVDTLKVKLGYLPPRNLNLTIEAYESRLKVSWNPPAVETGKIIENNYKGLVSKKREYRDINSLSGYVATYNNTNVIINDKDSTYFYINSPVNSEKYYVSVKAVYSDYNNLKSAAIKDTITWYNTAPHWEKYGNNWSLDDGIGVPYSSWKYGIIVKLGMPAILDSIETSLQFSEENLKWSVYTVVNDTIDRNGQIADLEGLFNVENSDTVIVRTDSDIIIDSVFAVVIESIGNFAGRDIDADEQQDLSYGNLIYFENEWQHLNNVGPGYSGTFHLKARVTPIVNIEENLPLIADVFNYPNPFNPVTVINFEVQKPSEFYISVYNSAGQLVKNLNQGFLDTGKHSVEFNGSNLGSGVYYYTISGVGTKIYTGRMILLK